MSNPAPPARWMSGVLLLAAAYNLVWGAFVVVWPLALFDWLDMARPNYPPLMQCIGMLVGVYGVAYAIAATDPLRHWPIVLVGLLGKVLGPIGLFHAVMRHELPWTFGWINVGNDLLWWLPFTLILYRGIRSRPIDR